MYYSMYSSHDSHHQPAARGRGLCAAAAAPSQAPQPGSRFIYASRIHLNAVHNRRVIAISFLYATVSSRSLRFLPSVLRHRAGPTLRRPSRLQAPGCHRSRPAQSYSPSRKFCLKALHSRCVSIARICE